jgi:hypothetical protein
MRWVSALDDQIRICVILKFTMGTHSKCQWVYRCCERTSHQEVSKGLKRVLERLLKSLVTLERDDERETERCFAGGRYGNRRTGEHARCHLRFPHATGP